MTKKFSVVLAAVAVIVTIAAPLSAQSVRLTANIPFEFSAGDKTLPAGAYSVMSTSTPNLIQVRNVETHASMLALTGSLDSGVLSRAGAPRLVFNRYGDHYVLSQIWGGSEFGCKLPKSRTERELAKTASTNRIEILAMLMSR